MKYTHKTIARHGIMMFAPVILRSLRFERLTMKNTIKKTKLARADKLLITPIKASTIINPLAIVNPI